MDTTVNTQPNNQLNVDPNMNQGNPSDIAVTKDMPKVEGKGEGKAENCEMMKADVNVLSGGNLEAQKDTQESVNKREQLHRRVVTRIAELEKELATLQGKEAKSEHANALKVELDIAKDATSGGWDHVGEMEAARLSKWLETSQVFVGSGPTDPASAGANLDPSTGEPRNTLSTDGSIPVDGSDKSVKATENSAVPSNS